MQINNPLIGYENKWVALTSDRKKVVAAHKDLKELEKKIKHIKKGDIILSFVLPFNRTYSF